ncbi:uncharacterized protein CDV56_103910 [Aspergillus thermomutatus]|uniref:Uncharacterized protein n=1 Tax=Aspergillus thermomutatus TaxID=41047 RepID=A0A397G5L0_ASPTH|nr:uncharacterized protein CDV56_103910 [Aspergillus thermomutatus]RHZ44868.1 hypothetical protein CDV56_103910 [Aspergillus thermomutatus]
MKQHRPVVRVVPNELSFNTAQSWKDIYGVRKGRPTFIKSDFYDGGNFADQASPIVSERDLAKHSEMRKFLATAFSDRSLREQESLITKVIDRFIDQVGRRGVSKEEIDMTMWSNLLTFDIKENWTIVSTNPLAASLGATNFDSPWTFSPERWLGANNLDQLEASQPFSLGPRFCLGRGLAWLELRLTLAKLHYQYDMELVDEDVDWHHDVAMHLLWDKPKLMMRVVLRDD